jgi:hypothetical protein
VKNLPVVPIGGWVSIKALTSGASVDNVTRAMWIDEASQNKDLPKWLNWNVPDTQEEFAKKAISVMWNQDVKTFLASDAYRAMRTDREKEQNERLSKDEFIKYHKKYWNDKKKQEEDS